MPAADVRFRVMASEVHVIVVHADHGPGALELQARAQEQLTELEQRWSRFLPESDISRINTAGGRPTSVAADTATLVRVMKQAWQQTHGLFDASVLPDVVRAGYHTSVEDPSRVTVIPDDVRRSAGMHGVQVSSVVDLELHLVTAPRGLALDPGGIGKGLAADLTVQSLLRAGAMGAMVSVGGDLAVAGVPPTPDGWLVQVEHPARSRGHVATLLVDQGGIATSAAQPRRSSTGSWTCRHVIDPATGLPTSSDLASVTVVAPTAWAAEAHATAALLTGAAGALGYLHQRDLTGLVVRSDGGVMPTDDLTGAVGARAS